ncbi:MAG: four helix bundle protein [Ignavibacteria bacterium]|nr:four helix bundle protein [Ignavibacteria bacterium]
MQDFMNLKIWEKSHKLTILIYNITNTFPISEEFGLKSQMRRSSVSIVSNIAEGCGRNSNNEFIHFLNISIGSIFELESQLELTKDLGFIQNEYEIIKSEITELKKMLFSFQNKLKEKKINNN